MSLQALIPPCAQTECDRFTGTIEKRSTLTPSSASLIAQARPASPPPTTITRLFFTAAAISPHLFSHRSAFRVDETQVMFKVLYVMSEFFAEDHFAALAVHTCAGEHAVRDATQH